MLKVKKTTMKTLSAVGQLFGDCFHLHSVVPKIAKNQKLRLICSAYNFPIFTFFKEYLHGWENIDLIKSQITIRGMDFPHLYKIHEIVKASFPTAQQVFGEYNNFLHFKKPIKSSLNLAYPYICFHADSIEKWKRVPSLFKITPVINGFSIGLPNERIIPGTKPFRTESISDIVYLLQNAVGVIGIHSSIVLLSNLLGIPTINCSFTKETFKDNNFNKLRTKILFMPDEKRLIRETKNFLGVELKNSHK